MTQESKICPCCGGSQLLRHARPGGLYWLCMSCREEVLPFIISQEHRPTLVNMVPD